MAPAPTYSLDDEEDDYVPYVPVKKQREALLTKLASKHAVGGAPEKRKSDEELQREDEERNGKAQRGNAQTLLMEAQEVKRLQAIQGASRRVTRCGVVGHRKLIRRALDSQMQPRRTQTASARRRRRSSPPSRRRRRYSVVRRRSRRASSTPSG